MSGPAGFKPLFLGEKRGNVLLPTDVADAAAADRAERQRRGAVAKALIDRHHERKCDLDGFVREEEMREMSATVDKVQRRIKRGERKLRRGR